MNSSIKVMNRLLTISPQKLSLVCDLIKKKNLKEIVKKLPFIEKKASYILHKILLGVCKSIEHEKKDVNDYFIDVVRVNRGPILKRSIYKAKGNTNRIKKRLSLLDIIVTESNV